MKCAIYARVSTTDQKCELQLRELREYCQRRGWEVYGEYVDTGWSGAKASRPRLNKLMQDAAEYRFDCVLVWKLDRFGRSLVNLTQQLEQLKAWGVRFIASTQGLDTDQNNPVSGLLFHILGAVAEFERETIRERVKAGLENARANGKYIGGHKKIWDREKALELSKAGLSVRKIAEELKISVGSVHSVLKNGLNGSKTPVHAS